CVRCDTSGGAGRAAAGKAHVTRARKLVVGCGPLAVSDRLRKVAHILAHPVGQLEQVEAGLLDQSWQATWIGGMLAGGAYTTSPAPFLRTSFHIDKPVARARLYATALGVYEAYLNGSAVSEDVFAPGWTDYDLRVQYQAYDVSAQLHQGENVLGAILGDGWYAGHVAWMERQRYGDRPRLLARLVITYDDGSSDVIVSGPDWAFNYGPILESDMIMGESYDARRELTGWNAPGYDAARWLPVEIFADPGITITAMRGPTVRRIMDIRPVAEPRELPEFPSSKWLFDMGQNMVGRLRIRVRGEAGSTITLRHAEMLNPDGTLYTANLRTAKQADHYTLKGEGEEIWEPYFTFHGFQYVELSGFQGTPTRDTVTGVVLHSTMAQTGAFSCSDARINQLQHNIEWGQRGNFVDVPTDCPQRNERLGWTGDAQVFIATAAFNFDVAGFFSKWIRDVEDAQSPAGAYPMVVPNPVVRRNQRTTGPAASTDGGPAWADAGVICPWTIYLCYGDKGMLAERYQSMQRYVDFLHTTSRDGIRCYADYDGWHGFGDWLALDGSSDRFGNTSKELLGTAFFAYSSNLLSQAAGVLGKHEDEARYRALFEDVRRAFQARFVTARGLIGGASQTSYVLALHFDLLPAELRPVALDELVRDIQRRDNHLATGFVGTPYISRVLSDNGRADVAYALLHQTTWPSWLYSVTQGATTIWERWDGWTHDRGFQDPSMNSFNHYAYGAIGAWLYAVVAGIDVDPQQPGYKRIVMRPQPGGGLSSASAELQGPYGTIRSAWKQHNGHFDWQITVPPNSTALVVVPVKDGALVYEGETPAAKADGVRVLQHEPDTASYEVQAGSYHFNVSSE
ncbi:family 78 glycoside hydrolase catalytic domain, partial [Candidatus Gracilibacteria bacterium]|nr:family 78 glycoside hydrolase catalytic domain [Candidatus Gracilibacteria bacterium]